MPKRYRKSYRIDFAFPPQLGHVHMIRARQRYELIEIEDYVRKTDGETSKLLTWLSECRRCGAPFTVRTGLIGTGLNRSCPDCVDPRRKKSGTMSAKLRAAREMFGYDE